MCEQSLVVIGASAGGVQALIELVSELPASFAAAVFVVVHTPANHRSLLPKVLNVHSRLPAVHASDGETILPGHIYVAPPDRHLLVEQGVMRLTHGPKENHSRPAADPLFRSAAQAYGPCAIGVVLSGALYDGTAGLIAIKRHGGAAITQDPDEAQYASMPKSAISRDHPDYILPIAEIASTLVRLLKEAPYPQKGSEKRHAATE